ncbi:hypothetical protein [Streptomyces pseudoechinosporeus]
MWFPGRRRRRPPDPCVFCSRKLKPKDQVAAMKEDLVRELYGRVPAEPAAYIDPDGDQRWFAHLICMNSATLKAAGELDITCVVCGQEVGAEERKPADEDGVRKLFGVERTKPGEKPDPADVFLTAFEAALRAWQCQRCARWQCNRCVCAALAGGGSPIPDHADCGGRFAPPT